MLRNPADKPQTISIDIAQAFELPVNSTRGYTLHGPRSEDAKQVSVHVDAGQPQAFSLQPFEVLVLEGAPH